VSMSRALARSATLVALSLVLSFSLFCLNAIRDSKIAHASGPALQLPWTAGVTHNPGISRYGCSYNCLPGHINNDYYAIDFNLGSGSQVSAVLDGIAHVTSYLCWDSTHTYSSTSYVVWVDHGGGLISYYAHLDGGNIRVGDGSPVAQGQLLALSDNSGYPYCSNGSHLHFAMHSGATSWNNGSAFMPEPMSGYTGFGAYGADTGIDSPAYTSSAPFHSSPATASRWSGALDLFWAAPDLTIHHRWTASPWSYEPMPGGGHIAAGTGPAAVAWDSSHLDVFIRGSDGLLYHQNLCNGGAWSGSWDQNRIVVIAADSSPAVTSRTIGNLDLFWAASDGSIHHNWLYGGGNSCAYSSWGTETMPGSLQIAAGTSPIATAWDSSHLDVWAQGANGLLYHQNLKADGTWTQRWDPDVRVAIAPGSSPGAAANGPGNLDVFWAAPDFTVHHMYEVNGYYNWTYETVPGGGAISNASAPSAVHWGIGDIDLGIRGTDGYFYSKDLVGTNWSQWHQDLSVGMA
jgi:hypothetical protein